MGNNAISNKPEPSSISSFSKEWALKTLTDANEATKEDFAAVVGDEAAALLIEYRNNNTRFKRAEDFYKVKGLARPFIRQLKEKFYVSVDFSEKLLNSQRVCKYLHLEDFHKVFAEKPFFFFHANVSNLKRNLFTLVKYIHPLTYLPDVICVTGTKSPSNDKDITLLNYDLHSTKCRCLFQLLRGTGGSAIYVKKDRSFTHNLRSDLEFGDANTENTWVELIKSCSGTNIIVGCVHRHRYTGKIDAFLSGLKQSIQKIKTENKLFYIFAGTNIDHCTSKEGKAVLNLLEQEECKMLTNKPTCINETRRGVELTISDQIYTNDSNTNDTDVGIVQVEKTYCKHLPLYCFAETH